MPVVSPIYNVLKKLVETNLIISNYKIKDMQHAIRNYFLVELDIPSSESIIQDYKLIDTHFSIDELYHPGLNSGYGYTPMHYTELFFSESDNKHIVVHGYINSKGEYQYSQAKELNESKEFSGMFITLSEAQEEIFKRKIKQFKPFIDIVLVEHVKLEQETKQKADQLEVELTKLSRDLDKSETRAKYFAKANLFSQAVKEFNQYSLVKDSRDKIVLRIYKNIEIIHHCLEKEKQEFVVLHVLEPEEKGAPEDSPCLPKDASLSDLYKITMQNIKETMNRVKKIEAYTEENLSLITQCAEQMHMQTLIFYSFSSELIKKEDISYVHKSNSKLNKYYDKYNHFLKENALVGNIAIVEMFFPSLKGYITESLYVNLIEKLLQMSPKESSSNILRVCDFFYKSDSNFRRFMSEIVEELRYPLSKDIIESFVMVDDKDAKQGSVLFMLYVQDKFSCFEALLRYGVSPDSCGVSFIPGATMELTLFLSIVYYQINDYFKYLRKLLEYNVDCNSRVNKKTMSFMLKAKSEVTKFCLKLKNHKVLHKQFIEKAGYESPVTILTDQNGTEGLELIVAKAAISDLAYSFAYFFEKNIFRKTVTFSDSYYRCIADNQYQAHELSKKIGTAQARTGLFLSYIFYPDPHNCEYKMKLANEIFEKAKIIDSVMWAKLRILSQENFEIEYRKLFTIAQDEYSVKRWVYVFCALIGCEYMLMQRAFVFYTDVKARKSFVRQYISELYINIINVIPQLFSGEEAKSNILFYESSKNSFFDVSFEFDFKKLETIETIEKCTSSSVNEKDLFSICIASRDGDDKKLDQLLLCSSAVTVLNQKYQGWTPLHFACAKGNIECAKKLMEKGASTEISNDKGKCPFNLVKDKEKKQILVAFKKTLRN